MVAELGGVCSLVIPELCRRGKARCEREKMLIKKNSILLFFLIKNYQNFDVLLTAVSRGMTEVSLFLLKYNHVDGEFCFGLIGHYTHSTMPVC